MSNDYSLFQKCVAEGLGTFMIVGGGCGAVCAAKFANYSLSPLGISLTFGACVTMAIYTTRDVSGAHLNPAITAALAINKPEACSPKIVLPYMAA